VSALLVSLIFGCALAAPFVCVAYFAQQRVHTRQVADYEERLYSLNRALALAQENLDRRRQREETSWARECERFWEAVSKESLIFGEEVAK